MCGCCRTHIRLWYSHVGMHFLARSVTFIVSRLGSDTDDYANNTNMDSMDTKRLSYGRACEIAAYGRIRGVFVVAHMTNNAEGRTLISTTSFYCICQWYTYAESLIFRQPTGYVHVILDHSGLILRLLISHAISHPQVSPPSFPSAAQRTTIFAHFGLFLW